MIGASWPRRGWHWGRSTGSRRGSTGFPAPDSPDLRYQVSYHPYRRARGSGGGTWVGTRWTRERTPTPACSSQQSQQGQQGQARPNYRTNTLRTNCVRLARTTESNSMLRSSVLGKACTEFLYYVWSSHCSIPPSMFPLSITTSFTAFTTINLL